MTLIASDGYEYEDLKARILGQVKNTARNDKILQLRASGTREGEVRAYIAAYDAARNRYLRHFAGVDAIGRLRTHLAVTDYETRTGVPYPAP